MTEHKETSAGESPVNQGGASSPEGIPASDAQARDVWIRLENGWRMHCHILGEGPPVLFLHGSGPGASGWSNFAQNGQYLARAGYQCILADSLGYGQSDKPLDVAYTLPVMAGAVLGLMDGLGHHRFSIAGNSQGGAQALWLALEHPQRVERLILMAPGGLEEREIYMEMKGIRSMMRCLYGPEGLTLEGLRRLFEKQLYDPSLVGEALVQERFEAAAAQPLHVFRSMKVDNLAGRLHELRLPVLGLWGMDDCFCPVSGALTLATRVPGARVTLFSQCGHWVMVEHAEVFNRLCLDFLTHG